MPPVCSALSRRFTARSRAVQARRVARPPHARSFGLCRRASRAPSPSRAAPPPAAWAAAPACPPGPCTPRAAGAARGLTARSCTSPRAAGPCAAAPDAHQAAARGERVQVVPDATRRCYTLHSAWQGTRRRSPVRGAAAGAAPSRAGRAAGAPLTHRLRPLRSSALPAAAAPQPGASPLLTASATAGDGSGSTCAGRAPGRTQARRVQGRGHMRAAHLHGSQPVDGGLRHSAARPAARRASALPWAGACAAQTNREHTEPTSGLGTHSATCSRQP